MNSIRLLNIAAAVVAMGLAPFGASPATAQDDSAKGRIAYINSGCANCHGDKGQGGGQDPHFPQGPSLRKSALDHETFKQVISCGIPGSQMPAWLRGAYTKAPCYGDSVGPVPEGLNVTGILTPEDVEAIVDYIEVVFQKKTPSS
jgi:mono/diheme cytochrome c family protein